MEAAGEQEEEEESAAEEEAREKRRKARPAKKPVAKKAKVNGEVAHEKSTAVKQGRAKKGKKIAIANNEVGGLYGMRICTFKCAPSLTLMIAEVYTSGANSDEIASIWLQDFQADMPAALTDLINFVLKSSGSPGELTEDHINDPDNIISRIQDLQDEYQEVGPDLALLNHANSMQHAVTDYPLISKAKSAPAFRASLISFIESLMEVLHETDIMYDNRDLIENIIQWVGSMSTSNSRPFRHTATVVALTINSSISRILKVSAETTAKNQQLLEGEQKKKSSNKARVADFQRKVDKGADRKEYLEERLKDIFETVYLNRYRDVDPKIRVECVEALAHWILELQQYWMDGQYLRYLGWMLTDSTALMRQQVIKQLFNIMSDEQKFAGMRHFFERFRPRVVEMATQDSEPSVRAAAVELTDKIREAGFLEPDDIDMIGKLIFDTEPKVRKAVVNFFVENVQDLYDAKVEDLGGTETLEDLFNDDDEDVGAPRASWIKVKCLAEMLLSYDAEDQGEMPSQLEAGTTGDYLIMPPSESRFTLAAHALFEQLPELKDWDMLASYLLFDHTAKPKASADDALREAFKPEEQEEVILLEMLNAAVNLSLTKADEAEKKKATKSEGAQAKENAARRLADLIPRLLKKYGATPRTATVVLRLEHALNLEVFQSLRQESTTYAQLLDEISAQFRGHGDKDVLSSASAALLHARGYEELEDVTENKVQALWEETIDNLQKISNQNEDTIRGSLNMTVLTELSNTVARLSQLACISDCVELFEGGDEATSNVVTILNDLISRGVFEAADEEIDLIEDELCISASRTVLFYFMWKVRSLTSSRSRGESIPENELTDLRSHQDAFLQNIIASLSSRSTLDTVRLQATGILLDFFVLFRNLAQPSPDDTPNEESPFANLNIKIDPRVQEEILSIFTSLEKAYSKKAKKPLLASSSSFAAASDADPEADPASDAASSSSSSSDSDNEDEDDEKAENAKSSTEKQASILKAEQQLCELTSKLVLALLAGVLDDGKNGRTKKRLQRNRTRLGGNFREVVAFLDGEGGKNGKGKVGKEKGGEKRSHSSKAKQAAAAGRRAEKEQERGKQEGVDGKGKEPKSKELVVEEEEEGEEESEDDPFAEEERWQGDGDGDGDEEMPDEEAEAVDAEQEGGNGEEANGTQGENDNDDESMLGD